MSRAFKIYMNHPWHINSLHNEGVCPAPDVDNKPTIFSKICKKIKKMPPDPYPLLTSFRHLRFFLPRRYDQP